MSSWVRRSGIPGNIGKTGWVRSRAWIWLFSSAQSANTAFGRPDDVANLVHEVRIAGELEGLRPMRLQAEGAPDAAARSPAPSSVATSGWRPPEARCASARSPRPSAHPGWSAGAPAGDIGRSADSPAEGRGWHYEGLIRDDEEKLFTRSLFGLSQNEMTSMDSQMRMLLTCLGFGALPPRSAEPACPIGPGSAPIKPRFQIRVRLLVRS